MKQITALLLILLFSQSACGPLAWDKDTTAKTTSADPRKRVEKNLTEGRGFRLSDAMNRGDTTYSFASSNPLWKATLDILDFMPLVSANYSGGIIITDWYNDSNSPNQSIKITIRFLSNEIRVDALDIKVFTKNCYASMDCKITENKGILGNELKKFKLSAKNIYSDFLFHLYE